MAVATGYFIVLNQRSLPVCNDLAPLPSQTIDYNFSTGSRNGECNEHTGAHLARCRSWTCLHWDASRCACTPSHAAEPSYRRKCVAHRGSTSKYWQWHHSRRERRYCWPCGRYARQLILICASREPKASIDKTQAQRSAATILGWFGVGWQRISCGARRCATVLCQSKVSPFLASIFSICY